MLRSVRIFGVIGLVGGLLSVIGGAYMQGGAAVVVSTAMLLIARFNKSDDSR